MTNGNLPALLRPLNGDLPPEARDLADSLRVLFGGLEISVRRYAARRNRDAGAVSRYLNGSRLPPWDFILELARDVAVHRGESVRREALDFLRNQYQAATQVQGNSASALKLVQHQLVEADRKAQQSATQVKALARVLHDTETVLADVELQLRQLQTSEALLDLKVNSLLEERDDLLAEKGRLQDEIDSLKAELGRAKARVAEFEEECSLLERRLEALDGTEERALTSGAMAFGVLEMNGFTRLTKNLSEAELISTVEALSDLWRDVSSKVSVNFTYSRGGEVSFTASTAMAAAEAGLLVIEAKGSVGLDRELRIGLCFGQVFSVGGIVFGETVSRAEGLCRTAQRDGVMASQGFVDQLESEITSAGVGQADVNLTAKDMWERSLKGLGVTKPWLLTRP
ncbi:hypothetical protein ACFRFJ_36490 [Streptomyces hydrogenans]|uniref:hypothetical protein n=1 Tax=Streptomyces hydrogenans TaxID=1873719 RepID=UPI0036B5F1CB